MSLKHLATKLFVFDEIDSTNSCAKTLAEADMPSGTAVVAEYQSTGRGRLGRAWLAPKGMNLLFSVVIRPPLHRKLSGLLTFYAATAAARAAEYVSENPVETKWPNDLLLNGKKFCGILTENSYQNEQLRYSVIGVGMNVNQKEFPAEIAGRATSMSLETGKEFSREELFRNVMHEFDLLFSDVAEGQFTGILDEWNKRCRMFGKPVTVDQEGAQVSGTAVRLQVDGSLLLATETGTTAVYAGDVTVARPTNDDIIQYDGSSDLHETGY